VARSRPSKSLVDPGVVSSACLSLLELQELDEVSLGVLEPCRTAALHLRDPADCLYLRRVIVLEDDPYLLQIVDRSAYVGDREPICVSPPTRALVDCVRAAVLVEQ
jgi:hypothetical protein